MSREETVQIAPGRGGVGSALYCPIVRIDFQDQYGHKERGADKDCGVKEERREGETGKGGERRPRREKGEEEGGEEGKLSYKRGRTGYEEDYYYYYYFLISQETKGARESG